RRKHLVVPGKGRRRAAGGQTGFLERVPDKTPWPVPLPFGHRAGVAVEAFRATAPTPSPQPSPTRGKGAHRALRVHPTQTRSDATASATSQPHRHKLQGVIMTDTNRREFVQVAGLAASGLMAAAGSPAAAQPRPTPKTMGARFRELMNGPEPVICPGA